MRNNAKLSLSLLLPLALAGGARADEEKTVVVATLPWLADVARAVGGDLVTVESLVPPGTDPHFLVPTPALSVRLGRADVYLENGFQLELWSERVIDGARNQKIRPGYPGHCYVGQGVLAIQVPVNQTRAMGDVHPAGNPHIWLDPVNWKVAAKNVEQTLTKVRPDGAETFAKNRQAFEARLDEAMYGAELVKVLGASLLDQLHKQSKLSAFLREKQLKGQPLSEKAGGWLKRALALEGLKFVSYHQDWTWFALAFDLTLANTIEEKPGIPPSPGHLEELAQQARHQGIRVVVYSPFYPASRAEGVAESFGGVAVMLPTEPGESEAAKDVFALMDDVFARLEQAREKTRGGGQ